MAALMRRYPVESRLRPSLVSALGDRLGGERARIGATEQQPFLAPGAEPMGYQEVSERGGNRHLASTGVGLQLNDALFLVPAALNTNHAGC